MTDTTQIDYNALAYVLSLPQGRKVLWDILGVSGIYKQSFDPNSGRVSDFNSGARNIGVVLWTDCQLVSPEFTAIMIKEQGNADRREQNSSLGKPAANPSLGDASGQSRPGDAAAPVRSEPDPGDTLGFERFNGPGGRGAGDD